MTQAPKVTPPPAADSEERADSITLAALQSQITDLKAKLERLEQQRSEETRLSAIEAGWLSVADLFADLKAGCFGSDRRDDVRRVAAVGAGIRKQREG